VGFSSIIPKIKGNQNFEIKDFSDCLWFFISYLLLVAIGFGPFDFFVLVPENKVRIIIRTKKLTIKANANTFALGSNSPAFSNMLNAFIMAITKNPINIGLRIFIFSPFFGFNL